MHLDDVVHKYNAASKHYDRFMDLVFGRILDLERHRERVIGLIGNLEGKTVLDVGCGTGRSFAALVERVGPHGRVLGVDCSEGMLAQAERRIARNGWCNVELLRDDAVKLERIREPVDAVVSVWCYGTVYDLDSALNRALDVLRPGGSIAIMMFVRAGPERGPLRWAYPFYRFAVQCMGIDPAKDFDDSALQTKWQGGRRVLRARAIDLHEEPYLGGAGRIIAARKPLYAAESARRAGASRTPAEHSEQRCADGPLEEGAALP